MFKSTLSAAVLALSLAPATNAATYLIDVEGAHASINFETSHIGISVLNGRFDNFSGSFEFDEENPGASTVAVEIDANSINSNHAQRDNHLRSADFFDVANHTTASFVSTDIEVTGEKSAVITGNLTIRGVTKQVALDSTFLAAGEDPWGGYRAGFTGETVINLKDFGMDGMLGAADVKITVNVEGIRQ